MRKFLAAAFVVLICGGPFLLSSCADDDPNDASLKNAVEIKLDGDSIICDSKSVYVEEDGKIMISSAGRYNISGTLDNGMIHVDCVDAGQLELVLNGVSITNDDGPCVVINKAQKAVVTLLDGTVNTLTDGEKYKFDDPLDDEPDAALFSKEDLLIDGKGTLVIYANYSGAVFSKDGLTIDGGNIEINSVNHGIKGKDYLVINGGSLKIHANGDGLKSTNEESDAVGYIEINSGVVDIYSEDEAMQAISAISINGGTVSADSINNGFRCLGAINFNGGEIVLDADDTPLLAVTIDKTENCTVTVNGNRYNG